MQGTPLPNFIPDCVVTVADGGPVDLWVYAVLAKVGWVPHRPGDLMRADHPGSAIKYNDQLYELLRAEETAEGGYAFRYGLRHWDSRYTLRHFVNYTVESQMKAAAAHQEATGIQWLRYFILWLFPIAGLAPDSVQREWEKKTGVSMIWVSVGSAVFGIALAYALRDAGGNSRLAAVVFYLALDSFGRLFWIGLSQRPHGALLLALPYAVWQGLTRGPSPAATEDTAGMLLARQDEVRRVPGGNSLQICSWYFDTTLAGSALVGFEGAVYRPLRWHQEGKGLSRRWIYDLQRAEPQAGIPRHRYTCPLTPQRQKAVEDFTRSLDLAHSFALVWSIYPRQDQLRLQLLYEYEGARSTAITAGLFLICGVVQLSLSAALYRSLILALASPAYLILESVYRLYKAKVVGEPAGSIVGYVLRLVIRPPR